VFAWLRRLFGRRRVKGEARAIEYVGGPYDGETRDDGWRCEETHALVGTVSYVSVPGQGGYARETVRGCPMLVWKHTA